MKAQFSDILGMLRHERGISQRGAAADLGVSQALLSHYENGIREPGLPFVIKVCNYYGVSADFLLGIEAIRGGETNSDTIFKNLKADDNPNVQMFANSVDLIFKILEKVGSAELIAEASSFLGAAIYILFRCILMFKTDMDVGMQVPEDNFQSLGTIELIQSGMRFKEELTSLLSNSQELGYLKRYLETDFPLLCTQLAEILQKIDDQMVNQYIWLWKPSASPKEK